MAVERGGGVCYIFTVCFVVPAESLLSTSISHYESIRCHRMTSKVTLFCPSSSFVRVSHAPVYGAWNTRLSNVEWKSLNFDINQTVWIFLVQEFDKKNLVKCRGNLISIKSKIEEKFLCMVFWMGIFSHCACDQPIGINHRHSWLSFCSPLPDGTSAHPTAKFIPT